MDTIYIDGIMYYYDRLNNLVLNNNHDIVGKWNTYTNSIIWDTNSINYELIHKENIPSQSDNLFLKEEIDFTTIDDVTNETNLDSIYTRINGITPIIRSNNRDIDADENDRNKGEGGGEDNNTNDTGILSYLQSFGIYF